MKKNNNTHTFLITSANLWSLTFAVLLMLLSPETLWAQTDKRTWIELGSVDQRSLLVPLNQSSVLEFRQPISKVSIANPEVADILLINPKQMYVLGKALGSTNILVLDEKDRLLTSIGLEVAHDLDSLRLRLHWLMPGEAIRVNASQGSIVLSGEVSGLSAVKKAIEIARTYLPQSKGLANTKGSETLEGSGVINLMQVKSPQQIMLEVQVAEISRNFLKSMDVNFNLVGSDSRLKMGAINGGSALSQLASNDSQQQGINIPGQGVFANYLNQNLMFNALLDIGKEKGLAKVLSEPTLTTLSGQKARFISGGEFPVPVPGSDGQVTVQFKEYGVALEFLPLVLDDQRINLKLDLSVSELSNGNTVTVNQGGENAKFFIPSLRKRSVQNSVELSHGQTLGIAGLIMDNVQERINKYPGLTQLPVIGALFRSQEFIKGQTELVIFVTPHFAQAAHADQYIKPTQQFIEPRDSEFFGEGKLEGRAENEENNQTFPQFLTGLKKFFTQPATTAPQEENDGNDH